MKHFEPSAKLLPVRWPCTVAYEVFVQSFCDSNGDGMGDLNGLTSKLDYLQDLGVEALWLMPVHPSPSYHKYDVTDYYGIHPDYGTMDDFKSLVKEAHHRNMKVVMDLVLNHCSRLHPWFTQALNPDSKYRDYFIWESKSKVLAAGNLTKEKTADSDNVFQWNELPGQDELYFAYFWSGMPDLNYDNPNVREEMYRVAEFWLRETGVDGFRLDAAKHIYPDDRAADTHAFWHTFRTRMEAVKPDVYLIGEVWSALNDQVPYAKGFSALFNFDLAVSILESVKKERVVSANVYKNTWKVTRKSSPVALFTKSDAAFKAIHPDFTNTVFLTNHDQERVVSFLGNNDEKARLAAAILLTLPGAAYIYYGEELGMAGKKPDQYIREPFPWSDADSGNTSWLKPKHNPPGKITPFDVQRTDSSSMYHHYRRLIHFRRGSDLLTLGDLVPATFSYKQVLAWYRTLNSDSLLIIHNLCSRPLEINPPSGYSKCEFTTAKNLKSTTDSLVLPPYKSIILSKPKN